ncbi:hypothetical protein, partial [Psychrobacter faecalis]|uniref:hypothetical protein n=1 Tax=Psychrobacter faecalis TaxID=180588 RepID=UPI001D1133E3
TMPNFNRLSETLTQNLSMNKARINCLSLMIIALITAQSSNLKKNSKTSFLRVARPTVTIADYSDFLPKRG